MDPIFLLTSGRGAVLWRPPTRNHEDGAVFAPEESCLCHLRPPLQTFGLDEQMMNFSLGAPAQEKTHLAIAHVSQLVIH